MQHSTHGKQVRRDNTEVTIDKKEWKVARCAPASTPFLTPTAEAREPATVLNIPPCMSCVHLFIYFPPTDRSPGLFIQETRVTRRILEDGEEGGKECSQKGLSRALTTYYTVQVTSVRWWWWWRGKHGDFLIAAGGIRELNSLVHVKSSHVRHIIFFLIDVFLFPVVHSSTYISSGVWVYLRISICESPEGMQENFLYPQQEENEGVLHCGGKKNYTNNLLETEWRSSAEVK